MGVSMSGLAAVFTCSLACLLVFSAGPLLAATTELPVKGTERILISVPEAVINLQATPGAKTLKINLTDSAQDDFLILTQDNTIQIKPKEALQKENFGKLAPKKRIIEISGRALPVEIHAFDGQVQLTRWSREALVHLQKGRVVSKEGAGHLKAHSQTGDITVLDHQGQVTLDTYKSNITVRNHSGDMDIENFTGETTIDKAKGFLSFNQGLGTTKIMGSSGSLQFEVNKGNFNVHSFLGRVEGQTIEGPVTVQMANDSEVNLKSKSGKVTVVSSPTSGALLNLTNQDGEIFAPNYLRVSRDGGMKTLRGRLKGDATKGSIVIRSQEGSINIR
jgi:hypothetical protein